MYIEKGVIDLFISIERMRIRNSEKQTKRLCAPGGCSRFVFGGSGLRSRALGSVSFSSA